MQYDHLKHVKLVQPSDSDNDSGTIKDASGTVNYTANTAHTTSVTTSVRYDMYWTLYRS